MANPTFTLIASNTVGSGGASSVTFSSIPATYTDLVVKVSSRTDRTAYPQDNLRMQINGDSGSNYSFRNIYGNGSSAASTNGSSITYVELYQTDDNGATTNTFGSHDIYIPNYTSSNYKSISSDGVAEQNGTQAWTELTAALWNSTAAINSLTFFGAFGNFVQYSDFTLYGVNNS